MQPDRKGGLRLALAAAFFDTLVPVFNPPLAYFLSFRAYGTWLHGDDRGSVDRVHNTFGTPMLPVSPNRVEWEQRQANHAEMVFDAACRLAIDNTIREVCTHRGWNLLAINVRTNHVHVVVAAPGAPEPVMNAFKSWATRRLIEAGLVEPGRRVWSRHGSTVYLFRPEKLEDKIRYVSDGQ